MSRNWTENQKNAIFANNGSVLVSAAAGSGKTAVLVQKIIELITSNENPIDVDRLLVVTFTRSAAAEMKERVSLALNSLLKEDPYNQNLLRQKQLIYKANISTIDSFCIEIIREYFYALDINKDFRLTDDHELKVLENEAMESTIETFYNENTDEFKNLVKAFASPRDDKTLKDTIHKVYTFLRSHPFPDKWLNEKFRMYDVTKNIADTVWGKEIFDYSKTAVNYCRNVCDNATIAIGNSDGLNSGSVVNTFAYYSDFIDSLAKLLDDGNWDKVHNFLKDFINPKMVFPKKFSDEFTKNQLKNIRDNIKETIGEVQKLFYWSEQECREDIAHLAPLVRTMFDCVSYYNKQIDARKRSKNILDFADVEHLMIRLFVNGYDENGKPILTDKAKEVSKRFDHIMVDECQDVNEVQDLIFRAISKDENNLFMVGDVKQSIYGFRQAMPEIFLARKNSYTQYSNELDNYPSKIILDKNFRSRAGIATGINFIFEKLMSVEVGDMEYTDEEVLNPAASFPENNENCINLTLIDRSSYNSEIEPAVLEARYIALKIQEMVLSKYQITDGGKLRDAQYGDFAILLRSTSMTSDIYVKELTNLGVPAFSEDKGSFFDTKEIKVMLNFLRVLDNPVQDIPLLSVMMSPMYGFTADELAEIKIDNRYKNLYSSLKTYADKGNEKAISFLNEISSLRNFAVTHKVDELIDKIYEITAYPSIISAVETRPNAVKNLNLLCDYASEYESSGYKGLSSFIHYLDKMQECGCDYKAGALVNGSVTNTVKVMSIHASKGLEYPVCFLALTSKRFNRTDLTKDVLLHSELGIGIRKRDGLKRYTTMSREGVSIVISKNQMSEELRILYVALTRAKEKLFILNSQENIDKYLEKLSTKVYLGGNIPSYAVKNSISMGDWLFMCGLINPNNNTLSLRALMDNFYKSPVTDENNVWDIDIIDSTVVDLEDVVNIIPADIFSDDILSEQPDDNFVDVLKERVNFNYKFAPVINLPTKVSASELAHKGQESLYSKILQRPAFASADKLSSTEKGTAFHNFLQYCDFNKAKENSQEEINRLKTIGFLTDKQAESIDCSAVDKFLNGSLGQRILKSKEIFREFRFMTYINAENVNADIPVDFKDEKILLQGAVDLAFVEDDQLVIVDYKTDRVKDITKLKDVYSKQLELYKIAMEKSTDYKVKECIIYSLYLDEFILI